MVAILAKKMTALTACILFFTPCALPAAPAASGPASRPAFELERLADIDFSFLVQAARRTVTAVWTGREPAAVSYRPPALRARSGRVHITLRRFGAAIGHGESTETDLLDGVVAAARVAVQSVSPALSKRDISPLKLGIELEWIGPAEFVQPGLDEKLHFQPELFACFEPGVDGIGVECDGRVGRARPSVVISAAYLPTLALQHAESEAGFTPQTKSQHKAAIRYFRFRTVHLWQPDAKAAAIRLRRGMVPVDAADVTRESLDAAISAAAKHLLGRQRRDAWFALDYQPSAERYSDTNSLHGQFEAAWCLGQFGRAIGSDRCVDVASRVFTAAQSFAQPIAADAPAMAVIGTKEAAPLATTGFFLAGCVRFARPENKIPTVQLADAIRLVQHEDGRFEATFPPDPPREQDAGAAGTALIGLLEYAADRPNSVIDRTLRQAIRYYANYFRHLPSRSAAAGLGSALAAAYRRRPDPATSGLLLEIGDWLVRHQVRDAWGAAPELVGGFVEPGDTSPNASAARCLLALCDAHWMAGRLGDKPRQRDFEAAIRLAARFVMQLQFRGEECFYVGSPETVIGGVRASPWNNDLRANDTAAALWALTRAREELFGGPPAFDSAVLPRPASAAASPGTEP